MLEENENNIISQVNHHMSLNTKTMENFNNTITSIAHNQEIIAIETSKITTELNKFLFDFNHFLQVRNILDQLNLSLQTIHQILSDLETALVFAKTSTLHNSLIKPKDLKWIVTKLTEFHFPDQLLYTKEEDIIKYYDTITVDGYYTNQTLVFIFHFPILYSHPFAYYHLFSIPTKNKTTIIPPAPFLIINENLFQYMDLECKKNGVEVICPEKSLQENSKSTDCVSQLLELSNEEAPCNHVPIHINTRIIQEISEAYYIAIFPKPSKISTHCSTSKLMVLEGNYLIKLPPNCEFRTNEETFTNTKTVIREEPLTLPKIRTKIQGNMEYVKPIKLKGTQLDQLHKVLKEDEELQPIEITNQSHLTHFWTTPLYIVITILILAGLFKIKKRRTKRNQPEDSEQTPQPPVLFVPYKTSSGDGEVTG